MSRFCFAFALWGLVSASSAHSSNVVRLFPETLDLGWNSFSHGIALPAGAPIVFGVEDGCEPGSVCDVSGPLDSERCDRSFLRCSSNDDCGRPEPCRRLLLPPVPIVADGTPVCLLVRGSGDASGTFDRASGALDLFVPVNFEFVLGIQHDVPCPKCVPSDGKDEIGNTGTCSGGPPNGNACVISATTENFGNMSYDCPPFIPSAVRTEGSFTNLALTTGHASREASFRCGFGFAVDFPFCLGARPFPDECATNLDCAVCADDRRTPCLVDADCAQGACAHDADAASSCGFHCFVGFCAGEDRYACLSNEDCGGDGPCVQDVDVPYSPLDQPRPNACEESHCGAVEPERCSPPSSTAFDPATAPACFGNRIEREGRPGEFASAPIEGVEFGTFEAVSIFAVSPTGSPAMNNALGLSGPATIAFDGEIELTDTGSSTTTTMPVPSGLCGDIDGDGRTSVVDALRMLRGSLGLEICPACVCDVDDSGAVTAVDVLSVLARAVGLDVELHCSPC